MRILVAEDSVHLLASVVQGLREAGYAVDGVADGRQALIHARTSDYDVVVLDIMMPEMDGLCVLRALRGKGIHTHILLLTARDAVDDRVAGLRAGADDYLVKPFAFAELLARIQALARRAHHAKNPTISVGPLAIDTAARTARLGGARGRAVPLSPREYSVLEYLAHRLGKPVSRTELEEHLYDDRARLTSNAVDAAVCSLRASLEAAGCPPVIHTRRKFGYVLAESPP